MVLPVSVIDIEAQKKRKNENHGTTSSRANYSPFPKEIATLCCEFLLRGRKTVFDPFAGWGERGRAAIDHGLHYVGYDLSPAAIDKARDEYKVLNLLADSRVAPLPDFFDAVFTCPPYWNLEKYHGAGLDKAATFGAFVEELRGVFSRCYQHAAPGSLFVIMVGDWRAKGIYYDLEFWVSLMFRQFGADVHDKIVVSRKKVSKIKIMMPQCKRLGYTVRVHENLLVFRKP